MFISRRKYEADLEREYERGHYEAFRQVDEDHAKRAREKEIQELREKVCKLEYDLKHQNQRSDRREERKVSDVNELRAVPQGVSCPPDRLDI